MIPSPFMTLLFPHFNKKELCFYRVFTLKAKVAVEF